MKRNQRRDPHLDHQRIQLGQVFFAEPRFTVYTPPTDQVDGQSPLGSLRNLVLGLVNSLKAIAERGDALAGNLSLTAYGRVERLLPDIAAVRERYTAAVEFVNKTEAGLDRTEDALLGPPPIAESDAVTVARDREIRDRFRGLLDPLREKLVAAINLGVEIEDDDAAMSLDEVLAVRDALARDPLPGVDRRWARSIIAEQATKSVEGQRFIPQWDALRDQIAWARMQLREVRVALDSVPAGFGPGGGTVGRQTASLGAVA